MTDHVAQSWRLPIQRGSLFGVDRTTPKQNGKTTIYRADKNLSRTEKQASRYSNVQIKLCDEALVGLAVHHFNARDAAEKRHFWLAA